MINIEPLPEYSSKIKMHYIFHKQKSYVIMPIGRMQKCLNLENLENV